MLEFHGFTVENKIGAGGMSTVYMGHHRTLRYPVAVKILHPGMSGDKEFIARFEREARSAAALNNTNIVNVIDFGSENDVFFIVMQYVDGADLGKIFDDVVIKRDGAHFPLEIALSLIEEVAYGLMAAHKQGIIHRDIKPSNIMLSTSGHVKVADFGLARDVDDVGLNSDLELTMPGAVIGTPSYMSPEQAAGGKVDARTDIFSLGVMAFQLIVGRKPFTGETANEVQEQIINAEMPHLDATTCPRYTTEIGHLLTKMLAKDPAHRFQTMEQTLRALTAAAESIDPSGSVLKYKREYMTRFAEDPVGFADELNTLAINGYLKRGFHFKNLGLSSIGDALREFAHVLSLDADHAKAKTEMQELRKQAEESGIRLATETDRDDDDAAAAPGTAVADMTLVVAPDESESDPETADEPEAVPEPVVEQAQETEAKLAEPDPVSRVTRRPGGGNRTRLAVAAAVILATAAIAVFWPRGDSGDIRIADDSPDDGRVTAQNQEPEPPAPTTGDEVAEAASPDSAAAFAAQVAMIAARGSGSPAAYEGYPEAARTFDQAEQTAIRATEELAGANYSTAKTGFEAASRQYEKAARSLDALQEQRRLEATVDQELTELKSAAESAQGRMVAARRAADRSGSVATGSNHYLQARDITQRAAENFAMGDADGYRQASQLYTEAIEGFKAATARATTAAAGARAMQKTQAETTRDAMTEAKSGLAGYGADLGRHSTRYGDAEAAAAEGNDAFDQGDYETARQKYEAAAGMYIDSEPQIQRSLANEKRRAATAEINGMVETFFTNLGAGNYNRIKVQLNWGRDEDEAWRDLVESAVSLSDQKSDIQLDDDGTSATVNLSAALYYGDNGRVNADPYLLDFIWNLQFDDTEWKIIDVQTQ